MEDDTSTVEVGQFPQGEYVDALWWLPLIAAFDRLVATLSTTQTRELLSSKSIL